LVSSDSAFLVFKTSEDKDAVLEKFKGKTIPFDAEKFSSEDTIVDRRT